MTLYRYKQRLSKGLVGKWSSEEYNNMTDVDDGAPMTERKGSTATFSLFSPRRRRRRQQKPCTMPTEAEKKMLVARAGRHARSVISPTSACFYSQIDKAMLFISKRYLLELGKTEERATFDEIIGMCSSIVKAGCTIQTWVLCYYLFLDLKMVKTNGRLWKTSLEYMINDSHSRYEALVDVLTGMVTSKPELTQQNVPGMGRDEKILHPWGIGTPTGCCLAVKVNRQNGFGLFADLCFDLCRVDIERTNVDVDKDRFCAESGDGASRSETTKWRRNDFITLCYI